MFTGYTLPDSVPLRDPTIVPVRSFVSSRFLSFWKGDFLHRYLLPWHNTEEVGDAVQSSALLIVSLHNIPRGLQRIRSRKHGVAGAGVVVPAAMRFEIHRAQLPPSHRILNTFQKTLVLLRFADLKPVLDQKNTIVFHKRLEAGAHTEEINMLFVSAKAHHVLDQSAVVPASVKNNHFASRWHLLYVSLCVQL